MNTEPTDDQKIEAYIQQNRFTYTRKAIKDNLLAQGHSQEDIDRIWNTFELPAIPEPIAGPISPASRPSRGIASLIVFWIVTLVCPLFFLLAGINSTSTSAIVASRTAMNLIFLVAEFGALVLAVYLWNNGTRFSHIRALLLAINFVLFVIVLGTCLSGVGFP